VSAGVAVVAVGPRGAPESAGEDGMAVELPATVGVRDEKTGGADGGAESAIVGCRNVSRYVPSVFCRPRRCQVVNRVTGTAPAAVPSTKWVSN